MMVRIKKIEIIPLILLVLLASGCAQEKPTHYTQITTNIIEGVGIPGSLEIGMRLGSIPDRFPGATCMPISRASLTWWRGQTWSKHPPWRKPAQYQLKVPSVGATVFETSPSNAISQIHFKARKDYDWPYFCGALSSGLVFSGTNTVSLAEVIDRYGEPLHRLTHVPITNHTLAAIANAQRYMRQQETILKSGESLLMTQGNDEPYRLFYPSRGIYFEIENRGVHSFRIFKKVESQNDGHSPPVARSSKPTAGSGVPNAEKVKANITQLAERYGFLTARTVLMAPGLKGYCPLPAKGLKPQEEALKIKEILEKQNVALVDEGDTFTKVMPLRVAR